MASTNKTTNYQLSQFTSTDKPAWLGDYNQDMSKIDAGMKDNADDITTLGTTVSGHTTAISGLTSDVSTLQSTVSGHTSDISTLQSSVSTNTSNISTLQGQVTTHTNDIDALGQTINQVSGDISAMDTRLDGDEANITANATANTQTATKLENFIESFNLTPESPVSASSLYTLSNITANGELYFAQNSDGSFFKFYGLTQIPNWTGGSKSLTKVAIAGLSGYYGIKTPFQLNTAPDTAYIVNGAGITTQADSDGPQAPWIKAFAVGTDGYIYIEASTNTTYTIADQRTFTISYFACLYFNGSFGDTPTPPQA